LRQRPKGATADLYCRIDIHKTHTIQAGLLWSVPRCWTKRSEIRIDAIKVIKAVFRDHLRTWHIAFAGQSLDKSRLSRLCHPRDRITYTSPEYACVIRVTIQIYGIPA